MSVDMGVCRSRMTIGLLAELLRIPIYLVVWQYQSLIARLNICACEQKYIERYQCASTLVKYEEV